MCERRIQKFILGHFFIFIFFVIQYLYTHRQNEKKKRTIKQKGLKQPQQEPTNQQN